MLWGVPGRLHGPEKGWLRGHEIAFALYSRSALLQRTALGVLPPAAGPQGFIQGLPPLSGRCRISLGGHPGARHSALPCPDGGLSAAADRRTPGRKLRADDRGASRCRSGRPSRLAAHIAPGGCGGGLSDGGVSVAWVSCGPHGRNSPSAATVASDRLRGVHPCRASADRHSLFVPAHGFPGRRIRRSPAHDRSLP